MIEFNSFNLMDIINNDLKDKNIHYLNNIESYEIVGIRVIRCKYKNYLKWIYHWF